MDIEKWLCGLGLQQYIPVFRDNAIDAEVLSELTEADLEKLGVVFGHRKRLLKAIATLTSTATSEEATPVGQAPSMGDGAERRHLTVTFCDLVGSTELASRLDPEDMSEVIRAYHRCVAKTVARFGGFVAKYMGDGVLVYFGYPQAHEHDAERAVRAGRHRRRSEPPSSQAAKKTRRAVPLRFTRRNRLEADPVLLRCAPRERRRSPA